MFQRQFLDWTRLEAFRDDQSNVVRIMISVFQRVENIVGKGENPGLYQHFLIFLQCFQKASLKVRIVWSLKSGLCGIELKCL